MNEEFRAAQIRAAAELTAAVLGRLGIPKPKDTYLKEQQELAISIFRAMHLGVKTVTGEPDPPA